MIYRERRLIRTHAIAPTAVMTSPENKRRPDGRRQLLLYMDPTLILTLKRRALEEDRPLYVLVEEMLMAKLADEAAAAKVDAR